MVRARRVAAVVLASAVACVPWLDYDDLDRVHARDGGDGFAESGKDAVTDSTAKSEAAGESAYDPGELCELDTVGGQTRWCDDHLSPETGSNQWIRACKDKKTQDGSPQPCKLGCIAMDAHLADFCDPCETRNDGTFCIEEVEANYIAENKVLVTCSANRLTGWKECQSGQCVNAAPDSHCP